MDLGYVLLVLVIGIIAGGYGTIVGAGGGFIFVPALLLIFHMDPAAAAGTGLVIVLINSLSGVVGYAQQKRIHFRTGLLIGAGALPGSLIGVWLLQVYSSKYFYVVFATLLVALGIFLFTKNSPFNRRINTILNKKGSIGEEATSLEDAYLTKGVESTIEQSNDISKLKARWLIPLGFLMGILSSYLGIGGGWLLVPILIYLFRVSTHNATATSIFSLCLYSSVGVFSQLFYGSIDWTTVLWGGFGVIIGSQFGVFLSRKIPGKAIIQMLSILLIVIGFRMYFN